RMLVEHAGDRLPRDSGGRGDVTHADGASRVADHVAHADECMPNEPLLPRPCHSGDMRIALTGSSGKLGTGLARAPRAGGHEVIGMDLAGVRGAGFVQVDLTDYGQVVDAFTAVGDQHDGVDAVVHLGAIPAPGIRTDVATFHNNMPATFNVFWAAVRLGIGR